MAAHNGGLFFFNYFLRKINGTVFVFLPRIFADVLIDLHLQIEYAR